MSISNLQELLSNPDVCNHFFKYWDWDDKSIQSIVELYGFDTKFIHQHGGENKGLEYYVVVEFYNESYKQLVKFYGQYHSYVGSEYIGYKLVEAKQKMVFDYV